MKRRITKTLLTGILAVTLLLPACASYRGYQGATVGAAVGATAGALLSPGNPWRGGVIGGALGAVLGGGIAETGPGY